ncbi:MAG: GNAT family N-acetyltransferase [Myxococcota bacterium]
MRRAPNPMTLSGLVYLNLAIVDHTYVAAGARGTGLGIELVEALTGWAREAGVRILPLCPFARSVYARRPDLRDVLAQG